MASNQDLDGRLRAALADRYLIEGEIGSGGMATVYLAQDLKHDRRVAVKVLKPELAAVMGTERFLAEIRTTANLTHPHILPLHDSGEANGFLFYVMPYLEGDSLRARMDREGQLPVEEAVRIAGHVADALDYAHQQGVIHRDIKPGNILFQAGDPVVTDFGIALAISAAGEGRLTETGLSLGTPFYMSPEQAAGDQTPTAASDVYSLGCVLYEMLTGDPPHTGSSAQAILGKILLGEVTRPTKLRRAIPANVEGTLLRALERLPADRFESAAGMAAALIDRAFRHGVQAGATRTTGLWNWLTVSFGVLAFFSLILAGREILAPDSLPQVLRYRLALPDTRGLSPAEIRPRISISPDASQFLYVGPGRQGFQRLWLQARDQLEAIPIPGTEGALGPFFSPDGTRIGFARLNMAGDVGSLVVVSPSGGSSILLADSAAGVDGASWGTDGFIYYDGVTGAGTTGIMRIPAAGGTPEQVTSVDRTQGETDHVWPQALPEGKGVVFTVLRGAALGEADIAVFDLATGERRVLVRGVSARYSPAGYLIFARADGVLGAIPFDAQKLETRGEAIELADGIAIRLNGAVDLALSGTGTLVYSTGDPNPETNELIWVDRAGGTERVDPEWVGYFRSVALSPDGSKLAAGLGVGGWGLEDLFIKDLRRGSISRLSLVEGVGNYRPAWTSDGQWVTFISNRTGRAAVFRRRASGVGPAELLWEGQGEITQAFLTRDGEWLVFVEDRDLFAKKLDEDSIQVVLVATPAGEFDPEVSPDGRWLAYTSDESGSEEVYVSPFPNNASGLRWQVSSGGGFSPRWAHSGEELFFKTPAGDLVAVEVNDADAFELGERELLFSVGSQWSWQTLNAYSVSPDDQRFLIIQDRGNPEGNELVVVEGLHRVLEAMSGS